jgi:hypothetical protein
MENSSCSVTNETIKRATPVPLEYLRNLVNANNARTLSFFEKQFAMTFDVTKICTMHFRWWTSYTLCINGLDIIKESIESTR